LPSAKERKDRSLFNPDGLTFKKVLNMEKPKIEELLTDIRAAAPRVTWSKAVGLLILFTIFVCLVFLFAVVIHFLPTEWFKKFGYLGVFVANLLSSLGVIISPFAGFGDASTVAVAAAASPFWVALVASVGSTLGEITSYYVGYGGQRLLNLQRFERYRIVERWMKRYGDLGIFLFALLPLFIFDFVGIAAGTLRFPLRRFLLFCYLGRLPRAFIAAYFYTWVLEHILSYLPHWLSPPVS